MFDLVKTEVARQVGPINRGYPSDAWDLLSPKLSPERKERMVRMVGMRTNYIRLVVQDLMDPHNISACLRSADAFGILNVDVVTGRLKYSPSTASRGSGQWLKIKRSESIATSARGLKEMGYRIAAAYPSAHKCPLQELPVDQPVALVFGNEKKGVDDDWLPYIDDRFQVPMSGMAESLNVSVCSAICLYETTRRALAVVGAERYYISAALQQELLCEWVCKYHSRMHEKELAKLRAEQLVMKGSLSR